MDDPIKISDRGEENNTLIASASVAATLEQKNIDEILASSLSRAAKRSASFPVAEWNRYEFIELLGEGRLP
jgi:hypothetical protein